jgi:PIN domain nuclease of toxin-antitoxin system
VSYLLDTHVWLWMLTEPERLGSFRTVAQQADTELFLSAASTWELAIKLSIGRLDLPEPLATYVPSRMRSTRVTGLPIEHAHALQVAALPPIHNDPFDRLLIAQAMVMGIPIVTADRTLAEYPVATELLDGTR